MRKSRPELEPESPIPFTHGSNGEFVPREPDERARRSEELFRRTVDERSRRLGVSRERLGSWERGRFRPSLDGLLALRRVLGVSINELLTGEPAPVTPGREIGRASCRERVS